MVTSSKTLTSPPSTYTHTLEKLARIIPGIAVYQDIENISCRSIEVAQGSWILGGRLFVQILLYGLVLGQEIIQWRGLIVRAIINS